MIQLFGTSNARNGIFEPRVGADSPESSLVSHCLRCFDPIPHAVGERSFDLAEANVLDLWSCSKRFRISWNSPVSKVDAQNQPQRQSQVTSPPSRPRPTSAIRGPKLCVVVDLSYFAATDGIKTVLQRLYSSWLILTT
jgi:hypothetical protein